MPAVIRPVPDLPGYLADDTGNIWEGQPDGSLVLLKPNKLKNGYLGAKVRVNGRRSIRHVHTLVAKAFHGLPPAGATVTRHLDGDKLNCRPGNLAYGDIRQNVDDSLRLGRILRGEQHPNSKLSDEEARAVAHCLACGASRKVVAERFGVSVSVVASIARGVRSVGESPRKGKPAIPPGPEALLAV